MGFWKFLEPDGANQEKAASISSPNPALSTTLHPTLNGVSPLPVRLQLLLCGTKKHLYLDTAILDFYFQSRK